MLLKLIQTFYSEHQRREVDKIQIGGKDIKEILVMSGDNELIISITDDDMIGKEGYKVVCVPCED